MSITLLKLTSNQSIASDGSGSVISWSCAGIDDLGAWDSLHPTRITVPSGVTRMRLTANVAFDANSSGIRQIYSRMGGSLYPLGYLTFTNYPPNNGSSTSMHASGPWVDVTAGDYHELVAYQTSGIALNAKGTNATWFQAEFV